MLTLSRSSRSVAYIRTHHIVVVILPYVYPFVLYRRGYALSVRQCHLHGLAVFVYASASSALPEQAKLLRPAAACSMLSRFITSPPPHTCQRTVAARWARSHSTWLCSSVSNGARGHPLRANHPIKAHPRAGFPLHLPPHHHLHTRRGDLRIQSERDPHPMAARNGALALAAAAALLLLASSAAADSVEGTTTKVDVALYYESLCPYSARFVVNHLAKVFTNGLLDAIDLTLLPYGNAQVGAGGKISCQHGEYECFLNTVEACAIDAWPELNKHFQFIYCVEDLVVKHQYREWKSCFAKLGLDPKPVTKCYKSERGHELELKYANQTGALVPPHRYVPWVVVDGQPLLEDYENFEAYICKAYKGSPPKVCEGLAMLQDVVEARNGVSYNSDVINLEAVVSEGRESKVWLGDDDN